MENKEQDFEEAQKYARIKIADEAMISAGFSWASHGPKKKINPALAAHVKNAYRREHEKFYLEPTRRAVPESAYRINDPSEDKFKAFLTQNLDSAGAGFEEAGDYVAARNSRVAQAQRLSSNGYENYYSAALLYEAAREPKSAVGAYKMYLKENTAYNDPYLVPKAEARVSFLEKKIEAQNKRIQGRL